MNRKKSILFTNHNIVRQEPPHWTEIPGENCDLLKVTTFKIAMMVETWRIPNSYIGWCRWHARDDNYLETVDGPQLLAVCCKGLKWRRGLVQSLTCWTGEDGGLWHQRGSHHLYCWSVGAVFEAGKLRAGQWLSVQPLGQQQTHVCQCQAARLKNKHTFIL